MGGSPLPRTSAIGDRLKPQPMVVIETLESEHLLIDLEAARTEGMDTRTC